jgi:hypothetical protein
MNQGVADIGEQQNPETGLQETVVVYKSKSGEQRIRIPSDEALDLMIGWIAQYANQYPQIVKGRPDFQDLCAALRKCEQHA